MKAQEKYFQDGGLRARTTVKDEYSKEALKHQLMREVESLSRRQREEKGELNGGLSQTYKAMIQARQELLRKLP